MVIAPVAPVLNTPLDRMTPSNQQYWLKNDHQCNSTYKYICVPFRNMFLLYMGYLDQ